MRIVEIIILIAIIINGFLKIKCNVSMRGFSMQKFQRASAYMFDAINKRNYYTQPTEPCNEMTFIERSNERLSRGSMLK